MEIPEKYKKYIKEPNEFPGFPSEPANNYWRYPRIVNGWWHTLTGSEQKVLDYILRHTWGYDKDCDAISWTQFQKGIYSKKEHKWIDKGIGLSRQAIDWAINGRKGYSKGLIKKGFIIAVKKRGKTTVYKLKTSQQISLQ
ncbi:hypothetical protein DRH27_05375 [Candidatus Falkowbacteria bacterium]|nr:MAG: hypothetical protein DRH27_05375 [Candidatus Falkowbacteria bacterium]